MAVIHYARTDEFWRRGQKNDPNTYSENPQYIVQLIGKVVTVSVETVAIVAGLSGLE